MSDRDFGGLVREARDRLGMSPTRVADLIGRSPSAVKAWERGRSVPSDANVVSSLAAVLGVDEAALFEAAGLERPGTPARRSLGESLAEIAPSVTASSPPDEPPAAPDEAGITAEVQRGGVDVQEAQPEADVAEPPPFRSRREFREQGAPAQQAPTTESESVWSAVSGTLDRIAGRLRRRNPRRHALVARPIPATAPPARPSYLEDPEQRLLYRFRSVLLAVGVGVLALVFAWSMGEFLDAIGSSLDALFGSE